VCAGARRTRTSTGNAPHNEGFKARKDAKAFLVLTLGEVARGTHTPESSSITVFEAAQLWLKRGELSPMAALAPVSIFCEALRRPSHIPQ
jgi:hypothetical protein